MDTKKPGMLRHLRQKMLPRLRRGKTGSSKLALQAEQTMDYRMSSSVPDMRDMRYSHGSSSTHLQQYSSPSYSSPSSPFVKAARGPGGGSGRKMEPVGGVAGRSEHRLSVPIDSTDWASSQESFNSPCEEEKTTYLEASSKFARGMEPEELALPEMMTVYSPELPSAEVSQDDPQVQTIYLKRLNRILTKVYQI